MKEVGIFNKLTPYFKDYLQKHKLKKGEVAHFQMLTGQPNIDPDPAEVKKQPIFYNQTAIPARDIIVDPTNNQAIDIALCENGEDGKPVFRYFLPYANRPQFRFNGRFSFTGGNSEDERNYEYCLLTNYRSGTEWRDDSKEIYFALIDFKAESIAKTELRDKKRTAMNKAAELRDNMDKAIEIAASLNWPVTALKKDPEILFEKIESYAEENPKEFLELYDSELTVIKSEIKKAIDNGMLTWDAAKGNMMQGATVLTAFNNTPNFDYLTAMAEWIQGSPNGNKVLSAIKNKNKTKQEAQTT